jgi:hypothetical protein
MSVFIFDIITELIYNIMRKKQKVSAYITHQLVLVYNFTTLHVSRA